MQNTIEEKQPLTTEQLAAIRIKEKIYKELSQIILNLNSEDLEKIYLILKDTDIDNLEAYDTILLELNYTDNYQSENIPGDIVALLRNDILTDEEKKLRRSEFSSKRMTLSPLGYEERTEFYGVPLHEHYIIINDRLQNLDEKGIDEVKGILLNPDLSNLDTYLELMSLLSIPDDEQINIATDKARTRITGFISELRSKYLSKDEAKNRRSIRSNINLRNTQKNYKDSNDSPFNEDALRKRLIEQNKLRAIFNEEDHLSIIDELYNQISNIKGQNIGRDLEKITKEFNRITGLNVTEKQISNVIRRWKYIGLLEDKLSLDFTTNDIERINSMLNNPEYRTVNSQGIPSRDYAKMISTLDPNGERLISVTRLKGFIDELLASEQVTESRPDRLETHLTFIREELIERYRERNQLKPLDYEEICRKLESKGVSNLTSERLEKFIWRARKRGELESKEEMIQIARG